MRLHNATATSRRCANEPQLDLSSMVCLMSDYCDNCGKSVGGHTALKNWEAVCPHCGQLFWLAPGQIVACKVAQLARYGIIVELGDGVEGQVHVSELATKTVGDPADVISLGNVVWAKVL